MRPVLMGSLALAVALAAAACVQFPDDPVQPAQPAQPDGGGAPWTYDGATEPTKLVKPIADSYWHPDAGTTPDAWVPPDTFRPPDVGPLLPTSNSGQICYGSCPSAAEECLPLGATSQNGMCLGKCSQPGSSCPVANPATQLSYCALQDPTMALFYCVYFCSLQGQTFACPDSVNYGCEAPDPTQPTMKVCVPK